MSKCRYCGTENTVSAALCRVCTRPLQKEGEAAESDMEKAQRRSRFKEQITQPKPQEGRIQIVTGPRESWAPELDKPYVEEKKESLPQYLETAAEAEARQTSEGLKYGNSSGMGAGQELPVRARDWTWAGFVPLGLFAFNQRDGLWGVIGILLPPLYFIYIGMMGRRIAWQKRRFNSIKHFNEVMKVWSTWGLGLFLGVAAVLLVLLLVFIWQHYHVERTLINNYL